MRLDVAKFIKSQRGNVSVMFAMAGVAICGAIGVAVDFSRATHLQVTLQTAIDSAVLAGAGASSATQQKVAKDAFYANIGDFAHLVKNVKFAKNQDGEFTGDAVADMPNTISQVLGFKTQKIDVDAAAVVDASPGSKVCALILDPAATQAFLVNSGAIVNATDCEFHVKSTASPAAIFNAASTINTAKVCIAGTNIIDNGGTHPNVQTGCTTATDPFPGTLPTPASATCDFSNGNYNGGNVTLNPGVYCGWFNFNAAPNVTLNPGTYVIKNGGWNVNGGDWNGNGVTFYYADQSKIQFNSAVKAKLSSPTSGQYKGIFMYEKEGLPRSPFVLDDSRGFEADGLIYLPSRDTIFNSASELSSRNITLVVNTLILDDTNWNLTAAEPSINVGGTGIKGVRLTH